MHANRRRLLRLVAVVAIITATLVPAVAGAAEDYQCDGNHYDATNPDHVLYGVSEQTPVVDGKFHVDLGLSIPISGTFVVFWDGYALGTVDGAVIVGSSFRDVICGTPADDTIYGMQGNDRIFGMGGSAYTAPNLLAVPPVLESWGDYLFGNKGNDLIVDGENPANLGSGGSFIGGGVGSDAIYTGDGDDSYARGGSDDDTMFAGDGDRHELRGGGDNDAVHAGTGDFQHIYGNMGDDEVFGGTGTGQVIEGNVGADTLNGGAGTNQRLYGGKGGDTFKAGTGNNAMFGGADDDIFTELGAGDQQVADGGPGNDTMTAKTTALSTIELFAFGGAGDDTLTGGPGKDCLYGDYATTFAGPPAEEVSLCDAAGPSVYLTPASVFINAVTTGTDRLYGKTGSDDLYGGPGDDIMYGNTPNVDTLDTIDGSRDYMNGNAGNDTAYGSCEAGVGTGDQFHAGAGTGDISWRFWAANIWDVEDPRLPCS